MTINTAVNQYIDFCRASGKTACTISSYQQTLTRLASFLGAAGLDSVESVTPAILVSFKADIAGKMAATSQRLLLTHLSCFFSFLVDMEIVSRNPYKKGLMAVEKSAIREQESKPYEVLTVDDFRQILTGTPALMHKASITRNRAILVTFLTTGLRNESLRELKVADIDFTGKQIRVSSAKGGKTGWAPLTDVCAATISDYLAECPANFEEPLFRTSGKAIARTHLSDIVEDAVREFTGKAGFRTHSLRHTFASLLSHAGMSDGEISLLLFHSDSTGAAVTSRYIERDNEKLFAKVNDIFSDKILRGVA